jgi:ATP-dependent RNA helicase DeaD
MTTPHLTSFADLGLRDELVATLAALGYEAPTPIQAQTIPLLLGGRDIIGQAQTGTGKTAAFALPILQHLDPSRRDTQALVLTPTRELAMQVAEAIHTYARGMKGVVVIPVYGGAPIVPQLKHLARGAHVVVGTPGRLIDHLDRKSLKLGSLRILVLDEADEMLRMGFIDDVERILSESPADRQTALFSATMPREVLRIAERHMRDAQKVEVEHKSLAAPAIEQRFINLGEGQKLEVLTQIMEIEEHDATLVFRRTKTGAAELGERLEARGFAAAAMHGDMNQAMRERVIRKLKAGELDVVVATDVAARGLDVEQIEHVVNYDVPHDVEVYVHRIGRTGRAGRSGVATLFVTPRERRMLREIEKFIGNPIAPMKIPTRADVAARRVASFKESLTANLRQGDLDLYLSLVEQVATEGPFDIAEVAAAAARLANGSRSLAPEPDTPIVSPPPPDRARRDPDSERKVRLVMAVGKADGLRPADVVGSIANEANVPGSSIGPIEIRDEETFVTVPARFRDQVLTSLARARFKKKPFKLRVAGAEGPPKREPKHYKDADSEKKKPKKRDGFAKEKKPFFDGFKKGKGKDAAKGKKGKKAK